MHASDESPIGNGLLFLRLLFWLVLGAIVSSGIPLHGESQSRDEDFLLRNWDTDDEMPSSTVNAIARDQQGYLWVATWRGLARFDGRRWVVFTSRTTPAIKDDLLQNVWLGKSGQLWLAPIHGGLSRFASNVCTEVLSPAATANRAVRDLAEDNTGTLWLATADGVLRLRNGKVTRMSATNGLPSDNISMVLCDATQQVWALANGVLLALQDGSWRAAALPSGSRILAIAPCRAGGLWVAALEGNQTRIFQWQGDSRGPVSEVVPLPPNLPNINLVGLAEDQSGCVWCVGRDDVLIRYPDGQWHQLLPDPSLSKIEIVSLDIDQDNAVWLGSRRTGLYLVQPRLCKTLRLPASAPPQTQILTVATTQDGSVWAGTDLGGICRWSNGVPDWFGRKDGLSHPTVNALLEDRQTNLWAGTGAGLCRWNGSRFEAVTNAPPLRGTIRTLLADSRGDLWVGGTSGLARWHQDSAETFPLPDLPPTTPVVALTEDPAGRIWAGAANGKLFVKETNTVSFQPVNTGAAELTSLNGIYATADGSIWILTDGQGLFRWRNGTMRNWDWVSDALPSDHQFGVINDRNGNLWISCERGIFGIAHETLNQPDTPLNRPLVSWHLITEDGLAQKICTGRGQPAATRSRDGRLWFPNGAAVAIFDPASVTLQHVPPPPIIEQILVDGLALTNGQNGFQILSGARVISFHFTSPEPTSPKKQHYRARLDGLDNAWMDMGDNREVSYAHLPPGDYSLHVAVANPDGSWPLSVSNVKFTVIPRFYERRSIQIAGTIFILFATAMGVWRWERARSARRLARLQFQQAMERERARIARDIHDELGSGLTEIILLSDSLQHDAPPAGEGKKLAQAIHERAQILTQDMDEVVWAVDARNDTVEGLLNYLNDFAQRHLNLAGIDCHLDIPPDIPNRPISAEVRHNLFLAAKEAINNITRHSRATAASIRATFDPPQFTLTIEDNGCGFEAASVRPHGSGLRNLRQRLSEIGGECVIEPLPARGSRIRFSLQINPNQMG